MKKRRNLLISNGLFTAAISFAAVLPAAAKPGVPTAAQALDLTPIQEVDYAKPEGAALAKCRVDVEDVGGKKSYVVIDDKGQTVRRFLDTNGDNKVDTWCYFLDNTEVYRDIDGDGNGKADQYRWLGTAGMRWAVDADEDTKIDAWKSISAEEATEEVVAALRTGDVARFRRVLLSDDERKALGIAGDRAIDLERSCNAALKDFAELAKKQKVITAATQWISFGGGKPGIVSSSAIGSKQDLVVYDNAAAVVETGGKHSQVAIGSMIRLGDAWRVIDVPRNLLDDSNSTTLAGFFFQGSVSTKGDETQTTPTEPGISPALQGLIADLEKIDKDLLAATTPEKQGKLNAARADLIERISELATREDRATWLRQYAETVSAAVQGGGFTGGIERLKKLSAKLAKEEGQDDLVVYVGYRALQTDYNQSLQTAKEADIPKIHSAWMTGLEKLIEDHAASKETAEPMLALAQEQEVSGQETEALKWYARIVKDFPDTDFAKKAAGAKRRLESIGTRVVVSGPTIDGKNLNPAALQGKVVVVQYWATWCDVCKQDFVTLKALQAKYGKNVQVIGINLDADRDNALRLLKATPLPWPTLYEPGGFDSRYANEMGIFTLPMTLLLDGQGKAVSRNITAGELDAEVRKLLK